MSCFAGSAAQKTPEELEQERRQHKLKRKQMGLYNLLASVSHVGAKRPDGVYKVFMHRAGDGTWYEVQVSFPFQRKLCTGFSWCS